MGKVFYDDAMQSSAVVLTANTQVESYFVSLIKDKSPGNKWQTTGVIGYVIIDHGSPVQPKAVYVDGSNIVAGDTSYTFKAGTTTACTNESLNLTKAAKSWHELSWAAYRYNRIDFSIAVASYGEIGKVYLPLESYEFPIDWTVNYQDGISAGIAEVEGFSGQQAADFLYTAQSKRLPFIGISDAQRNKFFKELMAKKPIEEGIIFYDHVISEALYGKLIFNNSVYEFVNYWNCDGYFTEFK